MATEIDIQPRIAQAQLASRELIEAGRIIEARPGDAQSWNLEQWNDATSVWRDAATRVRLSARNMEQAARKLRWSWPANAAEEFREAVNAEMRRYIGTFLTNLRQRLPGGAPDEVRHAERLICRLASLEKRIGSRLGVVAAAAAGLGLTWEYYNRRNSPAGNPDLAGPQSAGRA